MKTACLSKRPLGPWKRIEIHILIDTWSSMKEKKSNRTKIIFSVKKARMIGKLNANEWNNPDLTINPP